jgi:hypothetical protein
MCRLMFTIKISQEFCYQIGPEIGETAPVEDNGVGESLQGFEDHGTEDQDNDCKDHVTVRRVIACTWRRYLFEWMDTV